VCAKYQASNNNVKICFDPRGEVLYVKDGAQDGRSAIGEVGYSNVGCRNKFGVGTWVFCTFEWPEGWHSYMIGSTRDFQGTVNPTYNITGETDIVT
jgi:hypothetical protein